jgi:hypothetical protein
MLQAAKPWSRGSRVAPLLICAWRARRPVKWPRSSPPAAAARCPLCRPRPTTTTCELSPESTYDSLSVGITQREQTSLLSMLSGFPHLDQIEFEHACDALQQRFQLRGSAQHEWLSVEKRHRNGTVYLNITTHLPLPADRPAVHHRDAIQHDEVVDDDEVGDARIFICPQALSSGRKLCTML